ncbi:accessory gene regulator B family protein [Alkalibacter rhizosphaerae]|uniref:Accessory gene regulator B family protein n=1 Tax=Alkalibacter rhizosphaerae TaxID=2815577 RepID=A0A974XD93_9FIRM|nr:accessory gene regulator B family protein [Alkalibacter rhizosphaerae]QSX07712.1 accessory gene regulator B family protein [Alkalibacter rhizosphaerae]
MNRLNSISALKKLDPDNRFDNDQWARIQYALLAIGGDLSKLLLLFFTFSVFGHGLEFLYGSITTLLLRMKVGGKHFKSYTQCLVFSFAYFAVMMGIAFKLSHLRWIILGLGVVFGGILTLLTPQIPSNSRRVLTISPQRLKATAAFFALIYIAISLKKSEPIFLLGPLTIIFQSIQLIIMKGEHLHEKKNRSNIHLSRS